MRRQWIILMLVCACALLSPVKGEATTYTYDDLYTYWPGYSGSLRDSLYPPEVLGATVVTNDDQSLNSVMVRVVERVYWDSLFINTSLGPSGDYESWDWYVKGLSEGAASLHKVDLSYSYIYSTYRPGHPSGIETGLILDASGILKNVSYSTADSLLLYEFEPGKIFLDWDFVIGYSPYCANDVLLTYPVPEPATMLLFGVGLLGFATFERRRKRMKK